MTTAEFFTEFPQVVIYDFEVFRSYWLLTIMDAENQNGLFIETIPDLKKAYDARAGFIWAGYNSKHYDRFIMGALYGGISKADLYDLSQLLVSDTNDKKIWRYRLKDMKNYDVASFSMVKGRPYYSLKQLEAFMGHDIEESSIPWDYAETFTPEQKASTRKYCLHDVQETLEVLIRTISDFRAQADLIQTFNLDTKAWSMTKAQLTAEVLECKDTVTEVIEQNGALYEHERKLDFSAEEWVNYMLPCVWIEKYTEVLDFFSNAENYKHNNKLSCTIMGVKHDLGLGGIHGALRRYHQSGGCMMHVDVTSFYPTMMIEWGLLTRRTQKPELFKEIYNKRIELKKAGKKREQQPYKIILNSTFGISNDKYSKAYDPCKNREVCINGQLMLVMLLERLEGCCKLIQSNTDGIIVSYAGYDKAKILEICKEWERVTHMSLEYDEITEIWQKDVNNYLVSYEGGSYEAKGSYVKYDSDLGRDLAILNAAVRAGLIEGSEDAVINTINQCTDLGQFQKVFKMGSSYHYAYLGEQPLSHRCFRLFAVTDGQTLYKQKQQGGTKEKVADTPESSCIVYGDLSDPELKDSNGEPFSLSRLDRSYYIAQALKRYREMLPAD